MKAFLEENKYIDYQTDIIKTKTTELFSKNMTAAEKTEAAYLFVRDNIPHSFDCGAQVVTAKASDVLRYETGICHAKANLLAALLRSQGIPTGFCYQRLTLAEDASAGYCVHAYNTVFLNNKWVKLDARGNKVDVNARFSLSRPVLAFKSREEFGEYDWKGIYAFPHNATMELLESADSLRDVYEHIPDKIEEMPDIEE